MTMRARANCFRLGSAARCPGPTRTALVRTHGMSRAVYPHAVPASVSATLGWWRDTHRCGSRMQRSAADDHRAMCGARGAGYASHSARIAASWTHTPKSALDTALKSPEPALVRRSFRAPHNQRCRDVLHPSEVRCHVRTNAQRSAFVTLQDDDHRCGVVVLCVVVLWCCGVVVLKGGRAVFGSAEVRCWFVAGHWSFVAGPSGACGGSAFERGGSPCVPRAWGCGGHEDSPGGVARGWGCGGHEDSPGGVAGAHGCAGHEDSPEGVPGA